MLVYEETNLMTLISVMNHAVNIRKRNSLREPSRGEDVKLFFSKGYAVSSRRSTKNGTFQVYVRTRPIGLILSSVVVASSRACTEVTSG